MQTGEGLVERVYKVLCAEKRTQQLPTNNVGNCCVRVGGGFQMDATTPNNVGPSREVIAFLSPRRPCLMRVPGGPNNVARAVQYYCFSLRRSRN